MIPSYNYSFLVNIRDNFFKLAYIIISIDISATIRLNERLIIMDPLLIKLILSILIVEARHDAFLRHVRGSVPNLAPFNTGISPI